MLNSSQCDYIHLDVMDGVFVPNISFGFPVIRNIAKKAAKPLDVHLMIVDPDRYIGVLRDAAPEYVTVPRSTTRPAPTCTAACRTSAPTA